MYNDYWRGYEDAQMEHQAEENTKRMQQLINDNTEYIPFRESALGMWLRKRGIIKR